MNFVMQFHLRARENKFRIVIYRRVCFVMIHNFKFYIFEFLHSLAFIFHHFYSEVNEMLIQIRVVDNIDVDMLI